ncbi:LPS translocon maturation chaperone LptM [Ideonella sp.]|uniref:LPS translocon maturation chaperone LptM n=1 Tax=Ideonella sp. TaxID=1929293 RepID=UPI0039C85FD6
MPYRAASSVVAPARRLGARVLLGVAVLAFGLATLAGCGQRGALVLPPATKAAPAPAASPASAPAR